MVFASIWTWQRSPQDLIYTTTFAIESSCHLMCSLIPISALKLQNKFHSHLFSSEIWKLALIWIYHFEGILNWEFDSVIINVDSVVKSRTLFSLSEFINLDTLRLECLCSKGRVIGDEFRWINCVACDWVVPPKEFMSRFDNAVR